MITSLAKGGNVTMITKKIQIQIQNGMEARPVAVLVQLASQYDSKIYVESDEKKVNAKSIMGMMTLGLTTGEEVVVSTDGSDEAAAMQDIETFLSAAQA
jgi:phosphotransferase system HPr (HPr) family protein